VIWANNRRPRPEYRLANKFRPRATEAPAQPALGDRPEPTVIEADQ
jgi:hypothetical protein